MSWYPAENSISAPQSAHFRSVDLKFSAVLICMLSPCLFNFYAEYIMWNACQAGWVTSRNQGCWEEYQQTQICRWHHSNGRKQRGTKSLLSRLKEENEKAGLKLNIKKTKIMAPSPITPFQIKGKKWKQWQIFSSWAPKSLWMVTAAMKLEDACFLEGRLWQI